MNKKELSKVEHSDKAKVKYGIGLTIDLGNYTSARIDIGMELPFESGKEEEAYTSAMEFCNDKLSEEVTHLQTLKGKL